MKSVVMLLLVIFSRSVLSAQPDFDYFFENKTLRVDYFHTGTATKEFIGLDQAYEGGVWAGSRKNLIDTLNLGKYLVKVFDLATNQLVYSRGFASIYGEWETTGEAQNEIVRTFHESVLLPFPKHPVQVVIAKRNKWTLENRVLRDIAAAAPYDFIFILVNSTRYGGGGIYNLYATGMTGVENPDFDWHVDYMFTHEFGHSFAGLGDEYYSSSVSYLDFYPVGVEPWERNVTALLDPEQLKWKKLVDADTPLPTPWSKAFHDSLEAVRGTGDRSKPGYYEKWAGLRATAGDRNGEARVFRGSRCV